MRALFGFACWMRALTLLARCVLWLYLLDALILVPSFEIKTFQFWQLITKYLLTMIFKICLNFAEKFLLSVFYSFT